MNRRARRHDCFPARLPGALSPGSNLIAVPEQDSAARVQDKLCAARNNLRMPNMKAEPAAHWRFPMKPELIFALTACFLGPLGLAPVFADFPEPYNSEKSATLPLQPAEAAAQWKLPPGFVATVFASEPDVRQPIAIIKQGSVPAIGDNHQELSHSRD